VAPTETPRRSPTKTIQSANSCGAKCEVRDCRPGRVLAPSPACLRPRVRQRWLVRPRSHCRTRKMTALCLLTPADVVRWRLAAAAATHSDKHAAAPACTQHVLTTNCVTCGTDALISMPITIATRTNISTAYTFPLH
jgi:hypothetical protein